MGESVCVCVCSLFIAQCILNVTFVFHSVTRVRNPLVFALFITLYILKFLSHSSSPFFLLTFHPFFSSHQCMSHYCNNTVCVSVPVSKGTACKQNAVDGQCSGTGYCDVCLASSKQTESLISMYVVNRQCHLIVVMYLSAFNSYCVRFSASNALSTMVIYLC